MRISELLVYDEGIVQTTNCKGSESYSGKKICRRKASRFKSGYLYHFVVVNFCPGGGMADTLRLGRSDESRGSSSLPWGTINKKESNVNYSKKFRSCIRR